MEEEDGIRAGGKTDSSLIEAFLPECVAVLPSTEEDLDVGVRGRTEIAEGRIPVILPERDLGGDPVAKFELERDRLCRTGDEVLEGAALGYTVALPAPCLVTPSSRSEAEVAFR